MLKRKIEALLCAVLLLLILSVTDHAQADVTWVKSKVGQQLPVGAILGGTEKGMLNNGVSLYLCRASHEGGIHPGKLIAGKCNIPYGGQEIEKKEYQVAVGNGVWGKPKQGYAGALIGGQEPGRTLFVCRVNYQEPGSGKSSGFHPGKVVDGICNFGFGGMEINESFPYEVFYPNTKAEKNVTATPPADTGKVMALGNEDMKFYYENVLINIPQENRRTLMRLKGARWDADETDGQGRVLSRNAFVWKGGSAIINRDGQMTDLNLEKNGRTSRGLLIGAPISAIFRLYPSNYKTQPDKHGDMYIFDFNAFGSKRSLIIISNSTTGKVASIMLRTF